jgi:hypothetical protein
MLVRNCNGISVQPHQSTPSTKSIAASPSSMSWLKRKRSTKNATRPTEMATRIRPGMSVRRKRTIFANEGTLGCGVVSSWLPHFEQTAARLGLTCSRDPITVVTVFHRRLIHPSVEAKRVTKNQFFREVHVRYSLTQSTVEWTCSTVMRHSGCKPGSALEGWTLLEIVWRNPHEPIHPQENATFERNLYLVTSPPFTASTRKCAATVKSIPI